MKNVTMSDNTASCSYFCGLHVDDGQPEEGVIFSLAIGSMKGTFQGGILHNVNVVRHGPTLIKAQGFYFAGSPLSITPASQGQPAYIELVIQEGPLQAANQSFFDNVYKPLLGAQVWDSPAKGTLLADFPLEAVTLGWNTLIDTSQGADTAPVQGATLPIDITASDPGDAMHTREGVNLYFDNITPIDQSALKDKLDPHLLQGGYYGPVVTYTVKGLAPNQPAHLTLWFVEPHTGYGPGSRVFDVAVNGKVILPKFDIIAVAGAVQKAIQKDVDITADASGNVVLTLTGVAGVPDTNAYMSYARLS